MKKTIMLAAFAGLLMAQGAAPMAAPALEYGWAPKKTPYDAYVAAATVASLDQQAGQLGRMFRAATATRDALIRLRRAQAEGEVRCF